MKSILLAYNLLKRTLYKKYSIIIYTLLPLLGVLLSILFYSNKEAITIGVTDYDNSTLSTNIIEYIDTEKNINIIALSEEECLKKLKNDMISSYVIIPNNFSNNFISSNTTHLNFIYKNEVKEILLLKNNLNNYLNNIKLIQLNTSEGISSVFKKYNEIDSSKITIKEEILNSNVPSNSNLDSTIGFIIIFNLMIITNTLSNIIKDRTNLSSIHILLSNTNTFDYILGELIFNFIVFLIQGVLLIVSLYIFNINLGLSLPVFALVLFLIYLVSFSIGLFIISLCKTEEEIAVKSTLIIFPSCMLSGCLWPIHIMSDTLQNISFIFPQRHIFDLIYSLQNNSSSYSLFIEFMYIFLVSFLIIYIASMRIGRRRLCI